jgi:thiamine-phosphate pyrophosphorylase
MKGYYFITDAAFSRAGNLSDVGNAVEAGVEIVQYRNKAPETRPLYDEAMEIKKILAGTGMKLIINDRIDIALAVDAEGVHIGQEDMPYDIARRLLRPDKIIGVTVHDLAEALDAERAGADYLGVSPIFATGTKADAGEPCGTGVVREIRERCKVPIVAIGGISLDNVDEVISAGAHMVCAISAVVAKDNPKEEMLKFQRRFTIP